MATPEYGVGISNPFDLLGEDNAALKKAPKEGWCFYFILG
jgi:hypothetical protein